MATTAQQAEYASKLNGPADPRRPLPTEPVAQAQAVAAADEQVPSGPPSHRRSMSRANITSRFNRLFRPDPTEDGDLKRLRDGRQAWHAGENEMRPRSGDIASIGSTNISRQALDGSHASTPDIPPSSNNSTTSGNAMRADQAHERPRRKRADSGTSSSSATATTRSSSDRRPNDVTIDEVREQGLKVLLRSRLPLCFFLRSLLEEHSCENLICYLEIEHYESEPYLTPFEQQTAALEILSVYLSPRSPFEVNVTERAHAACQAAIASDDPARIASCFAKVKPAVFQLLLDAYMRFARNEWWRRMLDQLDGKHTYSMEDRNATVGHLIGYLDRLHKHDLVHAPDRAALFRELIVDFCRTVVGVEIVITSTPPDSSHTQTNPSSSTSSLSSGAVVDPTSKQTKDSPLTKLKHNLRKWG